MNVTAVSESPYSKAQQVYKWPGFGWRADVSLPRMTRAQAAQWQAFFLSLEGQYGTFLMGDPLAKTARGTATAATTNGAASARATSLVVDGMGNAKTLLKGDQVQIGSFLHVITEDVTSSAGGAATLTIEPGLFEDVADNTSLVLASPKGIWRMASADLGWSADQTRTYGFSFSCITAQ